MATTELGPFEFADKIPLKSNYAASGFGWFRERLPATGRFWTAAW